MCAKLHTIEWSCKGSSLVRSVNVSSYPYRDTAAAIMLNGALSRLSKVEGVSLRKLAAQLGYKQAAVISHMANGRVSIPLERSVEIAEAVGIPPAAFLAAAVAQKAPEAAKLLDPASMNTIEERGFVSELIQIAGHSIDFLGEEQKRVAREVMADPKPARRWLSVAELPVMILIRQLRPQVEETGLSERDRAAIEDALLR